MAPVLIDAFRSPGKRSSAIGVLIIAYAMPHAPTPADPSGPDILAPGADVRILIGTIPPGKARKLALALVEERLAACVNLIPGLRSIYRWNGDVLDEPETLLVIKTTVEQTQALARRLVELHPYQMPELLSLTPEAGLPAYLAWIQTALSEDRPEP